MADPEVRRLSWQTRLDHPAWHADLLLAIGSSLQVYPVAGIVPSAKASGARLVIVNAEATPFDDIADAVLRDPIGVVLPRIAS
jgi:NAD-dependent deacetylase